MTVEVINPAVLWAFEGVRISGTARHFDAAMGTHIIECAEFTVLIPSDDHRLIVNSHRHIISVIREFFQPPD